MSTNPKNIIKAILSNDKLSEDEKSEIVSEFIESIDSEYPELKYHATKSDVKETELKLTKEIENVRKEIKELDLKLSKEIENTRKEIKELDLKLSKEIENTRKEIKELDLKLSKEIENTRKEIKELDVKLTEKINNIKISTIKWVVGLFVAQTSIIVGGFIAIGKILSTLH